MGRTCSRYHRRSNGERRNIQLAAEGREPDQDEVNTADEGKDDAPPINVGSLEPTTPPPQDVLRGESTTFERATNERATKESRNMSAATKERSDKRAPRQKSAATKERRDKRAPRQKSAATK
jgi:hypothetical protein